MFPRLSQAVFVPVVCAYPWPNGLSLCNLPPFVALWLSVVNLVCTHGRDAQPRGEYAPPAAWGHAPQGTCLHPPWSPPWSSQPDAPHPLGGGGSVPAAALGRWDLYIVTNLVGAHAPVASLVSLMLSGVQYVFICLPVACPLL